MRAVLRRILRLGRRDVGEFSLAQVTVVVVLVAVLGITIVLKTGKRGGDLTSAPPAVGRPSPYCDIAPANDVLVIEAAIAGCTDGSSVRFPPGASYVLNDTIFVKDRHDLVIDGRGSTFKITVDGQSKPSINRIAPGYKAQSKNGGNWMLLRGTNITLKNMKAVGSFPLALSGEARDIVKENSPEYVADKDGDGQIRYTESMANFGVYGTDGAYLEDLSGFAPWGDTISTATDRYVDNFNNEHGGEPGEGNYARNVFAKRVSAEGTSRMCFALTSGINMYVEDSSCKSAWYGATDQEIDNAKQPLENVYFLRNTFDGFNLFGYLLPVAGSRIKGISIKGNIFKTPPDAQCNPTIGMGGYKDNAETIRDVRIEDNTMVTYGTAINLDSIAGGTVKNNKIVVAPGGSTCGTTAGAAPLVKISARSTGVVEENNGPDAPGATP